MFRDCSKGDKRDRPRPLAGEGKGEGLALGRPLTLTLSPHEDVVERENLLSASSRR